MEIYYNYNKQDKPFPVNLLSVQHFSASYAASATLARRKALALEEIRLPKFDDADEFINFNRMFGKGWVKVWS